MNRCAWAYRLWLLSQRRSASRFAAALHRPQQAQNALLQQTLRANQDTDYGKRHRFAHIQTLDDYRQRVPLVTGSDLTNDIDEIRRGKQNVLTAEQVTHLIPTSGTTQASKLIPYTSGLQRQFNAGIGPWITDLFAQHPNLKQGPAYWSISPTTLITSASDTKVPIGFDDDTAYLGRIARHVVNATLAAPKSLRSIQNLDDWRYATLWWLLQARELRLVSVWHPSFWTLLVDALPVWWERLTDDLASGQCRLPSGKMLEVGRVATRPDFRSIEPTDHRALWPNLTLISAWADASAHAPFEELQRRWPHVTAQPKGILSTEAFLSLPWKGQYPAAVCSHVIELMDDAGECTALHDAEVGAEYEAIVTTAGGLYRYRTGDRLLITGRLAETPTLQLLGRTHDTSDLCGEKLHEHHVRQAMQKIFNEFDLTAIFSMLAPAAPAAPTHYQWFVALDPQSTQIDIDNLAKALDHRLSENTHYAYAREIGQLNHLRLRQVGPDSEEIYLSRLSQHGQTLGNIKPTALSSLTNWDSYFHTSHRITQQ